MSREDAPTKARRLLIEGRLRVTLVSGMEIRAVCTGDTGSVYDLGFKGSTWRCSCPASDRAAACSHLHALRLVTLDPRTQWRSADEALPRLSDADFDAMEASKARMVADPHADYPDREHRQDRRDRQGVAS